MSNGIRVKEVIDLCGPELKTLDEVVAAVAAGKHVLVKGGAKWVIDRLMPILAERLIDPNVVKTKRQVTDRATGGKVSFSGHDDFYEFVNGKHFDYWTITLWLSPRES